MISLYSCKSEIDASGATRYRISKFDTDMNVEASYLTDGIACECPAGERPACRHRIMLSRFIARGAVNTFWLYDYERNGWVDSGLDDNSAVNELVAEMVGGQDSLPSGVQMFDLSKALPETLFNAIADAVGEPRLDRHPNNNTPKINRRGF